MAEPTRPSAVEDRDDRASRGRGHEPIPHTADAGFRAGASDLRALFQEAATALAEIAADVVPGTEASVWHDVALEADDLPSLAYTWLNELIALSDIHHAAVVGTHVVHVDSPAADEAVGRWSLRARVGLRPYAEGGVRALRQAKSATYHGLVVERQDGCWTLVAYLDL